MHAAPARFCISTTAGSVSLSNWKSGSVDDLNGLFFEGVFGDTWPGMVTVGPFPPPPWLPPPPQSFGLREQPGPGVGVVGFVFDVGALVIGAALPPSGSKTVPDGSDPVMGV